MKKLDIIMKKYPKTFEWMQHKARWEHIVLGGILNDYEDYINELMKNEDAEYQKNVIDI
jgi:hypothetical protein